MKKILLMSAVALSLIGASACSNNSNSTSNSSTKSSKTVQKKHWDKKKDQKLAKEMDKYGKNKKQTYTKYDGKNKLTTASRIYPDAFKKDTFKLNGKKISIGWSPQGEYHYDYDVMAIYNHDLTKDGQHRTFLFCWHKQKPIVLVDESSKGNVVNLHVSQDKSLNGSFSNIMNGENI